MHICTYPVKICLRLFTFFIPPWLPLTFKWSHDNVRGSIHELIHHVWLSIRLNKILLDNNIDILCLQEVEIPAKVVSKSLCITGFNIELETNSEKSRTCIYVSNKVKYKRRIKLEGTDSNVVIIDIEGRGDVSRIINLYRCFNPQSNVSAREKFKYQLQLIKDAWSEKCLIKGDFNLDYSQVYDVNYANNNLFKDFDDILSALQLVKIINFVTWSRLVGQILDLQSLIIFI